MAKKAKAKTTKAKKVALKVSGKKAAAGKTAMSTVLLLSKESVKSLARRVKESRARQGNISKGVRDELDSAKAKGLDTVAFNLALRWSSMMEKSSAQASLRWDQFRFVLFECLGFDDHYQKPLPFKKKKEPKQTVIEDPGLPDGSSSDLPQAAPESEAVH